MPNMTSKRILGGHALMLTGFNDATKYFTVRNSWGNFLGNKVYYYLLYNYVTNPAITYELYSVTKVGQKNNVTSLKDCAQISKSSQTYQSVSLLNIILTGILGTKLFLKSFL